MFSRKIKFTAHSAPSPPIAVSSRTHVADTRLPTWTHALGNGPASSLQRKGGDTSHTEAPSSVDQTLRSSGQPLDTSTRTFMEPRFGKDFSAVRVHTDSQAAQSADDVGARAYTVGQNVVFAAGQYAPSSTEGQKVIAHELAHTVQQQGNVPEAVQRDRQGKYRVISKPIPETDIQFHKRENRFLVKIGDVLVAEVDVEGNPDNLEITVDVTASSASIVLRHHGNAALASIGDPEADLGFPVRMQEIDLSEEKSSGKAPKAPPIPGENETEEVSIDIVPSDKIRWPDDNDGREGGLKPSIPPGALSEFEGEIRSKPSLIRGLVLDPDNSGLVIGYRLNTIAGLTRLVDREGNEVYETEIGLETPLIDPIDFLPTPGSAGKLGAGVAGRIGVKGLGKKAAVKGTKVSLGIINRMRGVAGALLGRAARKGAAEAPGFVRNITKAGLDHSFGRHAAEWFGEKVTEKTHYGAWRELVERVASSRHTFPWSVGGSNTIAHLGRVPLKGVQGKGRFFVVQFYEATGELATAFIPNPDQLREMFKLLQTVP